MFRPIGTHYYSKLTYYVIAFIIVSQNQSEFVFDDLICHS